MALLLQRIILGRTAPDGHGRGLHLPALALAGGLHEVALHPERSPDAGLDDLVVVRQVRIQDHLDAVEAGAVIER